MATEVINGTDVMVFLSAYHAGTTPSWGIAGHATSHSLSMKTSTRASSNKGTGTFNENRPGRIDVSGSLEGMYIASDTYNLADFQAAQIAQLPVLMIFGQEATAGKPDTTTSGGIHYYASGLFNITGVDATFPDQADSTYTVTFDLYSDFKLNSYLT